MDILAQILINNQVFKPMSDEEVVMVSKRKTNRLNLDSEEEARLEAEQQAIEQQNRQRKEQKRRRREQQARRIDEEAKRRQQLEQKYENPQTMILEDSNSHDSFIRVEKKIRKFFPEFRGKQESYKRRKVSESDDSGEDESEENDGSSESQSSTPKQKPQKKSKKEKRQRRQEEHEEHRPVKHKVQKVKLEQQDPKEALVKQLAPRWWYCLPEWPSADFSYETELRKLGYRLVQFNRFRMQENLVNGLLKAYPIDGFPGVYKTKLKIIDIRPKQTAPSLRFLRNKSIEQLTQLLRTALKQQIIQLQSQKYQLQQDYDLLQQLERQLKEIS